MINQLTELELAQKLGPELEAANYDAETTCRVNVKAVSLMRENGLLAMTIPAEYGGLECDALDSLKVIEELAYWDSAVGWSAMIYSKTAHLGAAMPSRRAREVYNVSRNDQGFDCPITAGAAAPSGKGKKVEGGVRVTGRWAWGSGTDHADWIAGGTFIEDDGDLLRLPNGQPALHLVYFPREEVVLHSNWKPSGLRGTGSNDFEVNDVFVPDDRWMIVGTPSETIDSPLYRFPAFGYFAASVASVPLGIARRAIDDFVAIETAKTTTNTGSKTKSSEMKQFELGQDEALVASARQTLWATVAEVWLKTVTDELVTLEDRKLLRLAAVQGTLQCSQAVGHLYHAAGGVSLQGNCSLQKYFRDINAATQHRQVSTEFLRMAGGIRLDDESTAML